MSTYRPKREYLGSLKIDPQVTTCEILPGGKDIEAIGHDDGFNYVYSIGAFGNPDGNYRTEEILHGGSHRVASGLVMTSNGKSTPDTDEAKAIAEKGRALLKACQATPH